MSGTIVGVSDHGGWAILVTIAPEGALLDRRRVELVGEALPPIPHHHEAQLLPLDEGVALVERVRDSVIEYSSRALERLAADVPNIVAIALRERQALPPTIAQRISDYRARNVADWVMYRDALATAASTRGWHVHWFDPKNAFAIASQALGRDFQKTFAEMRNQIGAPWNSDHKLALAGAIAASQQR